MKTFAILAAIGGGLLLLLIVLAPTIAETIALSKFSPAERAAMKVQIRRWRTESMTLPAEALEAKPYSEGIKAAAKAFDEAWEKNQERATKFVNAMEKKEGAPAMDEATAARELAALAPLVNVFTALTRHPDYMVNAISSDRVHREGDAPYIGFFGIQTSAKVLKHKALAEAKAGNAEAALREAETITRAAYVGPYETLISQLISVAVGNIGVKTWAEAVRACNEAAPLRAALEAQNALAARLTYFGGYPAPLSLTDSCSSQLMAIDQIGMLREMKRRGIDVEFQGLTGRRMVAQAAEAQAAYMETVVLPAVKEDAKLKAKVEMAIKGFRGTSAIYGGPAHSVGDVMNKMNGSVSAPIFYAISIPNIIECFTRANLMLSKLDLLRLETARKLYKLEKGSAPARDEDLAPGYLAALPKDRFGKEKEALHKAGEVTYSIGPDRKDDGNKITYDPTNGTGSVGDLALGR